MRKVRGDFGAEPREFNSDDDHMHLLVQYPPKVAVSALVGSLNSCASPRAAIGGHRPGEPAH